MKKIEALIRKAQYEGVKEKLHDVGVTFFSFWDVTGIGNEKIGRVYRGVSYSTSAIEGQGIFDHRGACIGIANERHVIRLNQFANAVTQCGCKA